jgi:predicted transcriptional regulator
LLIVRNVSILDIIGFDFSLEKDMAEDGRVVTAKLPDELVSRMDEIAVRIDRSKSWIVRQALSEWLAEEQHRYELTLEALKSVDEGRTYTQEEVEKHFAERRKARSRAARAA